MSEIKHKVSVVVEHSFTSEEINDIIVTALEGGINYWCGGATIVLTTDKDKFPEFEGVLAEVSENVQYASDVIGYGGKLKLVDVEDEEEVWELDIEKLLKGIEMYCKEFEISPSELMDSYDAESADSIVQYALFGELVYG